MSRPLPAKTPRPALTQLQLVATTYFLVSGGPYGLEDLIASAGYTRTLAILVLTPLVWSLPTALLVAELSAALPEDGGFYVWVRRALGPFWGFQEAWLTLAASVFDMAIYPTLFCSYLARLWPPAAQPRVAFAIGVTLIATCTAWNIRGARSVGKTSLVFGVALLCPFVVLIVAAAAHPQPAVAPAHAPSSVLAGVSVAIWNYMGWDNASTFASEVERPQRAYPRAMLFTVALVALTYVLPVAAVAYAGLDPRTWSAGSWADAGRACGGAALASAIVIGGMISSAGLFNALVLSYSRLPRALAHDGYLPRVFGASYGKARAPVVALVACALAYVACLGLGFERLVVIDVLLYGLALTLEFVALLVLRLREPALPRPFRVAGGNLGVVLLALGPILLLAAAMFAQHDEGAKGRSSLAIGGAVLVLGPLLYGAILFRRWLHRSRAT